MEMVIDKTVVPRIEYSVTEKATSNDSRRDPLALDDGIVMHVKAAKKVGSPASAGFARGLGADDSVHAALDSIAVDFHVRGGHHDNPRAVPGLGLA